METTISSSAVKVHMSPLARSLGVRGENRPDSLTVVNKVAVPVIVQLEYWSYQ